MMFNTLVRLHWLKILVFHLFKVHLVLRRFSQFNFESLSRVRSIFWAS